MKIPFPYYLVDGVGLARPEIVAHLQPCRIPEKVHVAYLQGLHLDSYSLLYVGHKFLPAFRDNVLNPVIKHNLGCEPSLAGPSREVFQHRQEDDYQNVGQNELRIGNVQCQAVDYRHGDDHEEICHLPHRHRLRPVSYHPEYGEEAQSKAYLQLDALHQEYEEEHGRRKGQESDAIFVPAVLLPVNKICDHPAHEKIEGESQEQVVEIGKFKKRHSEEGGSVGNCVAEFLGDCRIKLR